MASGESKWGAIGTPGRRSRPSRRQFRNLNRSKISNSRNANALPNALFTPYGKPGTLANQPMTVTRGLYRLPLQCTEREAA